MIRDLISRLAPAFRDRAPASAMRLAERDAGRTYGAPMDVIDDARIPATQKLRLLNDWESEVRSAMTASEDLLPGPLTAELHEVLAAKAELLRLAQ